MTPDAELNMYPRNESGGAPTPWRFVPFLYILQAIPVTIIQDLSSVFYKDLGVPNDVITTWTSVIALPWSLQFLLGALVDLSATKRKWILLGQTILTALLAIAPFLLNIPNAFTVSLIFLAGTAFVSALTNIATDGFYLLASTKEVQASFAGVQTASYRAGRLIVSALAPIIVGKLMMFSGGALTSGGSLHFGVQTKPNEPVRYIKTASIKIDQGELATESGDKLLDEKEKPITVPGTVSKIMISNGVVSFEGDPVLANQKIQLKLARNGKLISQNPEDGAWQPTKYPTVSDKDTLTSISISRRMPTPLAWTIALLAVAAVYGVLAIGLRTQVPKPALDTEPTDAQRADFKSNLVRTAAILGFYGTAYFALSGIWRTLANALSGSLPGWAIKSPGKVFGIEAFATGSTLELAQIAVCLPIAAVLYLFLRKSLVNTDMGEAFASFFRQSGIFAILAFMLFYRFAEAMVAKMSVLFLKDDLVNGGLALDNSQFGLVKGLIGVLGIVCGGIIGGLIVSKMGLKKSFWLIAALMHLPILLYLAAAIIKPSAIPIIGTIDFVDQFGYGLGYAGYTIYLMRVAQRGNHRTAHYAIGTGLGATFIALAGILSGKLFDLGAPNKGDTNGYIFVFAAALLFSIPGVVTLFFIPHDEPTA
jgi:MFS transporter, PAT family, beta-lactamase induction signal transducer AmpG